MRRCGRSSLCRLLVQPLNELNLFLPKDFGALFGFFESLQSIENPFAIDGFVFAGQPSTDERVCITVLSSRKADAAAVGALGPTSTPTDVFTVVFVVAVLVQLSINPNEARFISSGHPPFSRFNGWKLFQLDFDPALSGRFRFGPSSVLSERKILLVVDAFPH